ncbi:MAG: HPr family phosphocarrier protein, partial [Verrucomicrobiales bacterium]|nr:HPr family phosphocarrier protein [Verrucomicrobiales bacterium]
MEHFFHCPLVNGLHARPASLLQERAAAFASAITLVNERNNLRADAKSTLALMGADIRHGDPCRLTVSGGDEAAAHAALVKFLQQEFPRCDNTPPLTVTPARQLPRSLTLGDGDYLTGVTVSGGVGRGQARMVTEWRVPEDVLNENGGEADAEFARFVAARDAIVSALRDADSDVLAAHRSMLRDALLESKIRDALTVSGAGAGRAIHEAVNQLAAGLGGAGNYLRERVLDLRDIERRLIEKIYGTPPGDPPPLTAGTVVFARHLTPSQLLALNREFLAGLVLAEAGGTSHTAILARNFGIPTLSGIAPKNFPAADSEVIVDADLGILVTNISSSAERHYQRRLARALTVSEQTAASQPAATRDGRPLPVCANISTPDEIPRALRLGAEGVGLFRTEMLFIGRASPPDEEEQTASYKRAARL